MGVVDDLRNGMVADSDPDLYVVEETQIEGDTDAAAIEPRRLREMIREYPEACRVFRITNGRGYDHSVSADDAYTRAEHSGRIETDARSAADAITDECSRCSVRLDTSDPQLAAVESATTRLEVEIDDAIVRWVPPVNDPQNG